MGTLVLRGTLTDEVGVDRSLGQSVVRRVEREGGNNDHYTKTNSSINMTKTSLI